MGTRVTRSIPFVSRNNYLSEGLMSLNVLSLASNFSKSTGFHILSLDGGCFSKNCFGLDGLFSNPPVQLGQTLLKTLVTQSLQNVQSKEQIMALSLPLGKGVLQCSQFNLISISGLINYLFGQPGNTKSKQYRFACTQKRFLPFFLPFSVFWTALNFSAS